MPARFAFWKSYAHCRSTQLAVSFSILLAGVWFFAGSTLFSQPGPISIGQRWQQTLQSCALPAGEHAAVLDVQAADRVSQKRVRLQKNDSEFQLSLLDTDRRPVLIWTQTGNNPIKRRDHKRQQFMQQNPAMAFLSNQHLKYFRGPGNFSSCTIQNTKPATALDTSDIAGRPQPVDPLDDYHQYIGLLCLQALDPDSELKIFFYYKNADSLCPERALVLNKDDSLRLDIYYLYNSADLIQRVRLYDLRRPEWNLRFDLRLLPGGIKGPLLPGG